MTSEQERLESIGRAVAEGRPDAIEARVVGGVKIDPDQHVMISRQRLVGQDLSDKQLQSFHSTRGRFVRCSFRGTRIQDACWGSGKSQSEYLECCFDGAKFSSIAPGNARFVDCSFRGVRIYEFLGHQVELINCTLSGRIDRGFLNGACGPDAPSFFERKRNKITGNDFTECDLRDFAFRTGVNLEEQKLPTGPHYLYLRNAASALARARPAVESWDDSEMQRLASILLDLVQINLNAGQRQQFLCLARRGQFAEPSQRLRELLEDGAS
jgi:hypothetical protein